MYIKEEYNRACTNRLISGRPDKNFGGSNISFSDGEYPYEDTNDKLFEVTEEETVAFVSGDTIEFSPVDLGLGNKWVKMRLGLELVQNEEASIGVYLDDEVVTINKIGYTEGEEVFVTKYTDQEGAFTPKVVSDDFASGDSVTLKLYYGVSI